jgi:hypothetical protein
MQFPSRRSDQFQKYCRSMPERVSDLQNWMQRAGLKRVGQLVELVELTCRSQEARAMKCKPAPAVDDLAMLANVVDMPR